MTSAAAPLIGSAVASKCHTRAAAALTEAAKAASAASRRDGESDDSDLQHRSASGGKLNLEGTSSREIFDQQIHEWLLIVCHPNSSS